MRLGWYEFDEEAEMVCPRCGWKGNADAADLEIGSVSFHYECPKCSKALAVFSHVSEDETKRKAAEGNEKAKRDLPGALQRESFLERAQKSELDSPDQLPDLKGNEIVIEWDFEDHEKTGEDSWTVLRHDGGRSGGRSPTTKDSTVTARSPRF